jgi:hypothetical protein
MRDTNFFAGIGIRDKDRCGTPFADYDSICPRCDARHGPPGHELEIKKCQHCAKRAVVKSRNVKIYRKSEF